MRYTLESVKKEQKSNSFFLIFSESSVLKVRPQRWDNGGIQKRYFQYIH